MQDKKKNSLLRKQELFFIQLPIYSPDLKMVLIFLAMKVFQKGTIPEGGGGTWGLQIGTPF